MLAFWYFQNANGHYCFIINVIACAYQIAKTTFMNSFVKW